ncbi:hypothetical protein JX266_003442 [Neoarthrinium moseri]|nr:hypothetical protein JX266_003442 [Neoarthrinium moseri]
MNSITVHRLNVQPGLSIYDPKTEAGATWYDALRVVAAHDGWKVAWWGRAGNDERNSCLFMVVGMCPRVSKGGRPNKGLSPDYERLAEWESDDNAAAFITCDKDDHGLPKFLAVAQCLLCGPQEPRLSSPAHWVSSKQIGPSFLTPAPFSVTRLYFLRVHRRADVEMKQWLLGLNIDFQLFRGNLYEASSQMRDQASGVGDPFLGLDWVELNPRAPLPAESSVGSSRLGTDHIVLLGMSWRDSEGEQRVLDEPKMVHFGEDTDPDSRISYREYLHMVLERYQATVEQEVSIAFETLHEGNLELAREERFSTYLARGHGFPIEP